MTFTKLLFVICFMNLSFSLLSQIDESFISSQIDKFPVLSQLQGSFLSSQTVGSPPLSSQTVGSPHLSQNEEFPPSSQTIELESPPPLADPKDGEATKDILKVHNKVRAEVGVPPLVWNETLAEYAQSYANERSEDCNMEHSTGPYGENLVVSSEDPSIVDAVKFWATEKADYDPGSGTCIGGDHDCGHYTQVVARRTTSVGCAKVKCKNESYFIICSYHPFGNMEGEPAY
ncbi:hypothetical protein HRI_003456900 [Hibiscus trionum]|uniref:SCP domain-containing protein n=1 Tax=Hibiscus trionum TaxID=183268 RepID=A0A9W7ILM5_HIBTR|nr:hypothetical protein HRI_003456900 [Hibiscus trionum]